MTDFTSFILSLTFSDMIDDINNSTNNSSDFIKNLENNHTRLIIAALATIAFLALLFSGYLWFKTGNLQSEIEQEKISAQNQKRRLNQDLSEKEESITALRGFLIDARKNHLEILAQQEQQEQKYLQNITEITTETALSQSFVDELNAFKNQAWQSMNIDPLGVSARFPLGWTIKSSASQLSLTPSNMGSRELWSIKKTSTEETDLESFIEELGIEYGEDRTLDQTEIEIGEITAQEVLVQSEKVPEWYSKHVFIETDTHIYHLHNGDIKDDRFDRFVQSISVR